VGFFFNANQVYTSKKNGQNYFKNSPGWGGGEKVFILKADLTGYFKNTFIKILINIQL